MKIQICFVVEKNSDLYLMKIQISFVTRKKKIPDLYLMKIRFVLYFFFLNILVIISKF